MRPVIFNLIWGVVVVFLVLRRIQRNGLPLSEAWKRREEARSKQTSIQRQRTPFLAGLFGLVGMVCIGAALFLFYSTTQFIQKATRAQGQIVGFAIHRNSKGAGSYSPRVQYRTPSGEIIQFTSQVKTQQAWWPASGSTVEVLFDSSNPHDARLNHFTDLWFMPIMLMCLGGICLGIRAWIFRLNRSAKEPPVGSPPTASSSAYNFPDIVR